MVWMAVRSSQTMPPIEDLDGIICPCLQRRFALPMRVSSDLKQFVNDHGFITVTTGFCVGHAGSALIESIITDVVMRLLNPLLGNNDWTTHELVVGPFSFLWGGVFASALHLATVLWFVVYLIKFFEKSESP